MQRGSSDKALASNKWKDGSSLSSKRVVEIKRLH